MKIFISYKTENANIARGVAERLLSNGIQVWFAEYEIMLEEYFAYEEETKNAIANGVKSSTHAIILTNNNWVDAYWCEFEMKKLTENFRSIDNIVEVCIPNEKEPHRKYKILKSGDPILFQGDLISPSQTELNTLVYEIGIRLGIEVKFDNDPEDINDYYPIRLPNYEVSFNAGPLNRKYINPYSLQYDIKQAVALHDTMRFEGHINGINVVMHLFVHPFRSAIKGTSISQDEISDDKKVCDQYRKYALDWFSKEGWKKHVDGSTGTHIEGKGLHVVFISRKSHIGLTMKWIAGKNSMWERRYVISEKEGKFGKRIGKRTEAQLNFSVKPFGDENKQSEQFNKLTQAFEAIAQTFRFNQAKGMEAFFNNLPIVVSKFLYALLAWIGVYHFYTKSNPWWYIITASIIGGFFTVDIFNFIGRYPYRKLLWIQRPFYTEYSDIDTKKRFPKDLIRWVYKTPFTLFSAFFNCFRKPVGWILLITGALIFIGSEHYGPESTAGLLSIIQIIGISAFLGGFLNIFNVSHFISGKIKVFKKQ